MKETPFLAGHQELVNQFKAICFFQTFDQRELDTIFGASKMRVYDPQESIIHQGEEDRWLYVLIGGEVTVYTRSGDLSHLSHPGDIFGEFIMLGSKHRTASVKAVTEASCLAIDGGAINLDDTVKRCSFYAIIYRILAELLANRMRSTSEEISKLKVLINELKDLTFVHFTQAR